MVCSSYSSIFLLLRPKQEKNMNKNRHLVSNERYKIQHGLDYQLSFKSIAASIGKDCTTISKEVRSHFVIEQKGAPYKHFNDCIHRRNCSRYGGCCPNCERHHTRKKCSVCGNCIRFCSDYIKEVCPLLYKHRLIIIDFFKLSIL